MNQHPATAGRARDNPDRLDARRDARKLAENLMEVMSALLGVIERETELVRAGKLREAMAFEARRRNCRAAMSTRSRT